MSQIGRYRSQFIFSGCLAAVLSWQGQGALIYSVDWGSDPTIRLFSAQDSVTLAYIALNDKAFAARSTNDKRVIAVFDKLVYHALLEKCRGNVPRSATYFHRADSAACYFNDFFDRSFLSRVLPFYQSLAGDTLKTKLTAERFYYRGYELFCQGKLTEAEKAFQICRQLYIELQDDKRTTETVFHLASVAFRQRDYSRCYNLAISLLDKAAAEKYDLLTRRLYWLLGMAQLNLFNYEEAKNKFNIALKLADSNKDTLLSALTYEQLGTAFRRQGDFPQALEAVYRSQHLNRWLRDQDAEKRSLILLGMIYHQLGSYSEADQSYEKAYELNRASRNPGLSAVIGTNRAYLYIELGEWERALDLQKQAIDEEPSPQSVSQIIRFSNMGLIYSKLGDYKNALKYQGLALQAHQKTQGPLFDEAWIHLRMADSYHELGQAPEAEKEYQIALNISERSKGTATQILALLGLGNLYQGRKDFKRALVLENQALKLAQQTHSPELEWNASFALGRSYEALNEIDNAQRAYENALEKVETSRTKISADTSRMSFFATKQDVYDRLAALHLEIKKDSETALHYSERSRARMMLDLMGERFQQKSFVCDIPRLAELQRLMPPEIVFVEYKLLSDKFFIWVVKKESLEVATISVSRDTLTWLIREFLEVIGASNLERFRERYVKEASTLFKQTSQLGERLYGYLVAPIASSLSPAQVIYFVPDGILYYLPFAALSVTEAGRRQFLIEKYKMAFMPSLTVYRFLAEHRREQRFLFSPKMLAIGNPTGDLWSSEKEAKSVAGLFSANQILLRTQATKRAVLDGLRSPISYFHFAGHCRINEKNPMYSALLLSKNRSAGPLPSDADKSMNGMNDDGMLTVNDILNCSLDHVELATLSACETALGKLSRGEGMMGLSQVFLGSGIPTLISSLWKVDDRNSAELMEHFYRYFANEKYGKLEALRQAQLDKIVRCGQDKMIKYPFPYFWASYILNGMTQ